MTTRLGYHPALDGIRAISILAVMLYHSGLIHGGFLGVDVFFTLSGFLITTLLIEEHAAAGRIALRDFYCRRALRLLPALVPVVIVSGVAMIATAGPDRVVGMSLFVLAVIFYVANWGDIRGGDDPPASTRPRWQAAPLAAAVLVAVLVMARLPDDYARRGASTIVAVAAGILIVNVLRPGSRLAPLLAWSPLVWIGKRSYALYLWHLPVFFLAGALWASGILEYLPSRIVPAWVITFAMAAASYRWIEAPALRLKSRFAARPADRTPAGPTAAVAPAL